MTQTIYTKCGTPILVDDDDFEELSKLNWQISKSCGISYARNEKNGIITYMHRMIMNPEDGMVVDHIDGNGLNNQKSNLRVCTTQQNLWNSRKRSGTTSSKYKGVSWHKAKQKWQAQIMANGKAHHLGFFENEEAAAKAYNDAKLIKHGKYGFINSIVKIDQFCTKRKKADTN